MVVPAVAHMTTSAPAPPAADGPMRLRIERLLSSSPDPAVLPELFDHAGFLATVRELQALAPDDLLGKLVAGRFMLHPYALPDDPDGLERSCATCINYERHRRFCNLPELMLPVEPAWSCVVWRL